MSQNYLKNEISKNFNLLRSNHEKNVFNQSEDE